MCGFSLEQSNSDCSPSLNARRWHQPTPAIQASAATQPEPTDRQLRLRRAAVVCLVCWLGGMLTLTSARAQNPFGDSSTSDNPFGAAEPAAAVDPSSPFGGLTPAADPAPSTSAASGDTSVAALESDPHPVVRLLRETPPKTPAEMAQGLSWVVRLKRWDEVRRLLDLIATKNWSLAELAELAKSEEPSLWIRLSHDEAGLTEQQRTLINNILAAPSKLAREPAWLDQWIEKLSHPEPGERRLAQLRLQDGGRAAIERLLERLLAGDARVDSGMLAGTVAEFGDTGVDALKAACLVKDAQRAGRVFLGLAEVPGNQFSAELGAGLCSGVLSPETRQALAAIVQRRFGNVPTTAAIHDFLAERFKNMLGNYQQTRTSEVPVVEIVWRPTADGRSVQAVDASDKERQLEAVARLAAHRLNLTVATTEELVDCGAVVLQRAYQVQPGLALNREQEPLIVSFNESITTQPSYWIRVFDRATELQLHGGAVRAIELLVESAAGHYVVPLDFLTRLLGDSRPVIRYLALQQIAKLDPQQNFAGAEQAMAIALEMSQLAGGPRALVVGLSSELRLAAEQQLESQAGAEVTTASSARSALRALASGTPIEMVVVVDRLADQSLYEFLQRVRGSERGQSLPIAVLTDELYQHERRLIAESPGMIYSILSRVPDQMRQVVSRLMQRLDTQPLSQQERNEFASLAGRYLSRIAGDREMYAFYPLSDVRDDLLVIGEGLAPELRLELLSGIGSHASQLQLIGLASQGGLTADEREQAAQAFALSLHRFGMNLKREDVLNTYEAYNRLGPKDPATAAALGKILDAIEERATQ